MSGGSYDYLCFKGDLYSLAQHVEQLEQMCERLDGLSYGKVAAEESYRLLRMIRKLDSVIRHAGSLREVWRAVEWWDSCDSGEDQVREAIREYEETL